MILFSRSFRFGSMEPKWIEVFRAGEHTDSSGNTKEWTRKDLDTIVEQYAERGEDDQAPAVIGHPRSNSPAYGWATELRRKGDLLLAKVKPTVKEFTAWVNAGLYKRVSISLRPDMSLRHIGFLGGKAPAVKGLKVPEFAEEEFVEFETEAEKLSEKTQSKEDEMTDAEKKKLQEYEELVKKNEKLEKENKDLKEKSESQSSEFAELKKDFEASEQERKTARENLRRLNLNARKMEFEQFLNREIAWGSMNDDQKDRAVKILDILGGEQFSEDEPEGVKLFKEFLKDLPEKVKPGEVATRNNAAATEGKMKEFEDKVNEFMAANDGVDYKTAVVRTAAKHPDLYEAAQNG